MEIPKIKIFDTTLRDGEQSPGATLTLREKILIARQLEKLGVDIIEAGFPIASDDDFRAVKDIAEMVKKPIVTGLARARETDVLSVWQAVQNAKRPRIHTFMSSSDIHLKEQFNISREQALQMSVDAVRFAKGLCEDVEFSAMDATRTDQAFLLKLVEAVIDAGATTVNIPDTVGYAQPAEYGQLIRSVREKVPNIDGITISVHCHNDLGLAVANSLEAIRNGATQVECTINGLGERAGNASLEEIVMGLHTRKQYFNAETDICLKELFPTSIMVSNFTGMLVQRNKAIVGENAFAHEAGIHQHGLLANRQTYEIMTPETIGKKSKLILGKHSGRHAVKTVVEEMGFKLNEEQLQQISERIKQLADKQKVVFDDDIIAIAGDVTKQLRKEDQRIVLDELKIETGNKVQPTAKIRLLIDGKPVETTAHGIGSVDAVANAIKSIVPESISLEEYTLKAVTGGTDALADVVTAACFVKAFAIPFLALPRSEEAAEAREAPVEMRAGMGILAAGCVALGLGAAWFVPVFDSITEQTLGIRSSAALVTGRGFALSPGTPHGGTISPIGIALLFLIAGVAFAWPLALRWKRRSVRGPAWDCGLPGLTADNEYTATAFSKPLRMIFSALYRPRREIQAEYEVSPYYPSAIRFESEIEPAFEKRIYAPLRERILAGANRMRAIQAGSIHAYLAYIFIALVLLLLFGVRE